MAIYIEFTMLDDDGECALYGLKVAGAELATDVDALTLMRSLPIVITDGILAARYVSREEYIAKCGEETK